VVQRRPTLTTRGVIALCAIPVSAAAGALLGAEEFVLVSIALVVLLASGMVQSASRAGRARGNWRIEVGVATSDAEVGSELDVTVTLAAAGQGGATPVWLEDPEHCWERVHRGARAPEPRRRRTPNPSTVLRVAHLESGAAMEVRFSAPTERRGVFTLRGMQLWCFDTFGLVARPVAVGPSATITVHPVPLVVELGEELLRGERDTEDSRPVTPLTHPRRDSFGDFSGIRAYVPGDRLRLLYWPALARSGELMVRDFEDSGPHRVHVVADVRPLIGEAGSESVLATVAAVGLQVLAQGSVVELSTTAGERVAIGPGPLGAIALLRAIASLEIPQAQALPRWRGRRPATAMPPKREAELPPTAGTPLVVTTAEGMRALPGAYGFAHVVVAP
jgi:uncharacterized protein (DUF58 family)